MIPLFEHTPRSRTLRPICRDGEMTWTAVPVNGHTFYTRLTSFERLMFTGVPANNVRPAHLLNLLDPSTAGRLPLPSKYDFSS